MQTQISFGNDKGASMELFVIPEGNLRLRLGGQIVATSGRSSSQVGFKVSTSASFCARVQCLSSFSRAIALSTYWNSSK